MSIADRLRVGLFWLSFLIVYVLVVAPLVCMVRVLHGIGVLSNSAAARDERS
jgi:hypothetical protein